MFLSGIFFAVGWTACLGPILAGILGIGAVLGNIWYSALLLFFYSLGNLVPLFILSIFYDRYNLSQNRFIKGRMFTFSVSGRKYQMHSTNLISGILFLLIGLFLVVFRGTGAVNKFDLFGTRDYFYSIQNSLMAWEHANIIGMVVFVLFIVLLALFLRRYKAKNNSK